MISALNNAALDRLDDDSTEFNRFERITHRRDGSCPVRSHASRLKARMRSQGHTHRKASTINGAHRRRRHSYRQAPLA